MRQFIESGVSDDSRARRLRSLRRFDEFINDKQPPLRFEDVSLSVLLDFLLSLFNGNLAAATVQGYGAAIEAERRRRGLPLLLTGLDYNGFLRAMKVSRPTGAKYVGVVPYAPRDLVPFLLKRGANPFRAERERAVFLLRIDALLRPGEVRGILRSSIRDVRDPLQRLVVAFNYSSKQSERQHAASDSNYCSHSCQPDQGAAPRNLCPGCALLDLKLAVEALPGASSHDSILTDARGDLLSVDRARSIVNDLLRRAAVPAVFTAHSLRAAANQSLLLAGVDAAVIAVRAGWSGPLSNASQRRHYTHHRFVEPVFGKILLL